MGEQLEKAAKKVVNGILDGIGSYTIVWSNRVPDINQNKTRGGLHGDWSRIQGDFHRATPKAHGHGNEERKRK
jgi:hypothetical protein